MSTFPWFVGGYPGILFHQKYLAKEKNRLPSLKLTVAMEIHLFQWENTSTKWWNFHFFVMLVYRSVTHHYWPGSRLSSTPSHGGAFFFLRLPKALLWWNSRGTPSVTGSSLPSCLRSFQGRCANCKRRPPGPSHHDGVLHHEPTRTEKLKINPSWHANKPQDLSNVDKCGKKWKTYQQETGEGGRIQL